MKMSKSDDLLFFSMTYEYLEIFLSEQIGRSKCTVKSYRDALTLFRRYVLQELGISINNFLFSQCNRDCILGFMSYLKNTGSKASTRNQRLTALKTYLWFAADKNISLQSIALEASRVKTSKTRSPSREVLSEKALTAILAQPADTRMGLRDRTIMTLLYDSAARLAEILDLRMENITLDGSDPHIRVRGKGDKERVVSISEPAVKHLRYYSQYYRDCDNPETNLFFYTIINNTVNKMSESNVERFVQDYADKARAKCQEIPASVYPHMFRRTRATHLYQDGVALPLVSRILGHAQLDTTSNIYAKPSIKMMRDALNSGTQNENCAEKPLWIGSEDDLAKKSGLR